MRQLKAIQWERTKTEKLWAVTSKQRARRHYKVLSSWVSEWSAEVGDNSVGSSQEATTFTWVVMSIVNTLILVITMGTSCMSYITSTSLYCWLSNINNKKMESRWTRVAVLLVVSSSSCDVCIISLLSYRQRHVFMIKTGYIVCAVWSDYWQVLAHLLWNPTTAVCALLYHIIYFFPKGLNIFFWPLC